MKVVNEKPASANLHEKRDTIEIRGQMNNELKLKVKVENAKRERVNANAFPTLKV